MRLLGIDAVGLSLQGHAEHIVQRDASAKADGLPAGYQADVHVRVEELSVGRADDDVGVRHEVQATSTTDAVHGTDDRLMNLLHEPGDRQPNVPHGSCTGLLDVDTGAEELFAG